MASTNYQGLSYATTRSTGVPATPAQQGVKRAQVSQTRYMMRGWHSGLSAWIAWAVIGSPDTTGAQSGYPGLLSRIAWTAVRYGIA